MDEFPAEPPKKYTGKTKSRGMAFFLTLMFGPLGFLYFGFGAFLTALVGYTAVTIFTGGFALPFLGIGVPILTALCMEPGVQSAEYTKWEKDKQETEQKVRAEERQKQEEEYYSNLGMSKTEAMLKGDPNAKQSILKLVENVKAGNLKDALHNLHGAIDPVSATKAAEVREEVKVQTAQKLVSQACCASCSTQNEVGAKFCQECGENLTKAA